MKQFSCLPALITAILLCGCTREESSESFEPTKPGYFLFNHTMQTLVTEMNDLWPVFAFASYYAADSDEERERIHDTFFYSKRITHNGDEWRIIGNDSELVIGTGGKSLCKEPARWTYFYTNRNYYTTDLPTISSLDSPPKSYMLHLPQISKRECSAWGDLTLTATNDYYPAEDTHSIGIEFSGSGMSRSGNLTIQFAITDPLQYNSFGTAIDQGVVTLTTLNHTATDTTKAHIYSDEVYIEYNGYEKYWKLNTWI